MEETRWWFQWCFIFNPKIEEMIQFDLSDLSIFFLLGWLNHQLPLFAPMAHEKTKVLAIWKFGYLPCKPFVSTKNHLLMVVRNPFTCPTNKFDRKAPEATFGLPPFGSQQSFGAGGEEWTPKAIWDGEMVSWLIQISIIWMDVKEENHGLI